MNELDSHSNSREEEQRLQPGNLKSTGRLETRDGLRSYFQKLVSSKLSNEALNRCQESLKTLKKCSFYIQVSCQDPSNRGQGSNFTVQDLIDHGKFDQLKKFSSIQAKIQLCLLEELLEQALRGKEELVAILNTYDSATFIQEHDTIQKKLACVTKALLDFNSTLEPGPLLLSHRVITEPANALELQIQLDLTTRMPVVFDRTTSVAAAKTARLYWHVAGTERNEFGMMYEIHYKLHSASDQASDTPDETLHIPTTEMSEGTTENYHLAIVTSANSAKIGSLLPERTYEFTVRRANSLFWIYGPWSDNMVLKTQPQPVGFTSRKKKRWMYNF